jgi:hypothetical protein
LSVELSSTRMISSTQSPGIASTVVSSVCAALCAGMTTITLALLFPGGGVKGGERIRILRPP